METTSFRISVSLLLFNEEEEVFLVRNQNTENDNNNYGVLTEYLPSARTVLPYIVDVSQSYFNITLKESDLSVVLVMQLKRDEFAFFVCAKRYKGTITILDESRYDDSMWVKTELLPLNTIDYIKKAIQCYKKGVKFYIAY